MIYVSIDRNITVLTLVFVFLLVGINGICYCQEFSYTVNEVISAAEMRKNVLPFVVYIKTKKINGSGVVIKTWENNTFVLTNEHVTRGSDEVEVFFLAYDAKQNEIRDRDFYFGSQHDTTLLRRLGYAIEGRVVAEDKEADVAVIALHRFPKTLETIQLKNVDVNDHLKAGDIVHFFGHPGDQELLWQWNLGQFKGYEDSRLFLEARSWKGNSGGPVLNKKGELIGLIKSSDDITRSWAVPLEPIIDLVKDLKAWDIISIVNETESDVVYEVNWVEGETWKRNTLEPGEWKIHKQPTKVDGTFHPKIRYVSNVKLTPPAVDTDTKDSEEQNDEKVEEQNDHKPDEQNDRDSEEQNDEKPDGQKNENLEQQNDKNDENIVENEHKLRYINRQFFSSDDTDRIKPELDGYNYRFVSSDSMDIEFQEKKQTVWIANNSTETENYSIKWSDDRFDEDHYTLEPGKARPHWSTRTILGLSPNYPKIRYHYTIFDSTKRSKNKGFYEKSITTTKEMQYFPIDTKSDEHILDIEKLRKTTKDNIDGYYYLQAREKYVVPDIREGLPTPKNKQTETTNTPEDKHTETATVWGKLFIPMLLGTTVISLSVIAVLAIDYYFPRRHIFSIENNTESTMDFHIYWTKKTKWQRASVEPGKTQIYWCRGFFKKKPWIHFTQIVNYENRITRGTLETRSKRYRRSADSQSYQEAAYQYDFDYSEADEIKLYDSEVENWITNSS